MVEKGQHEPHWPWFFTGVTAPLVRQSTLPFGAGPGGGVGDGLGPHSLRLFVRRFFFVASQPWRSRTLSSNSAGVMSANCVRAL